MRKLLSILFLLAATVAIAQPSQTFSRVTMDTLYGPDSVVYIKAHFVPVADTTFSIGNDTSYVRVLYVDTVKYLDGSEQFTSGTSFSGWYEAQDTLYTIGSPLALAANDTITLPVNFDPYVARKRMPSQIDSLWSIADTGIAGLEGMALGVTVEFVFVATGAGQIEITQAFDIGGSIGRLYNRDFVFNKGAGNPKNITSTTLVYTLDTWEANAGKIKISSTAAGSIYGIRVISYIIHPPDSF